MMPPSRLARALLSQRRRRSSPRRRGLLRRDVLVCCAVFTSVLALCAGGCAALYDRVLPTPSPTTLMITVPTPTTGPDAYERSGRTTQLRLTLPAITVAPPFPLVIALHSLNNDSSEPQSLWGFDALAGTAGFAVAYPDALNTSWNAGTCCGKSAAAQVDDVGWLRALISHLEQHYPIDRQRVFLVGFSNGGMIAYRYACEHAGEIAGIAVVAASLQTAGCAPAKPVTVVAIHGQLDKRVPYAGEAWSEALGTPLRSARESLSPFRASAGCAEPSLPQDTFTVGSDGGAIGNAAGGQLVGLDEDGAAGPASRGGGAQQAAPGQAVAALAPPAGAGGRTATSGPGAGAASAAHDGYTAIRQETVCSSGKRIVEFLLPGLAHGWPPATGPKRFDTATVIWRLLAPMRSPAPGPDL
ncbi:plasmid partitioning protein [Protofrankia sp. BMG5.30]|uniref:Plasmid partitioning protein n=2 Tax=Frankiaceae TaxID=74712 RepID=A0ABR5F1A7_9ACTN|nr:plasmid partitioning protein [Protofrankia coriariae]ONH34096.1 plasmid partitioning protein [Protofrankia sp. BMG5.30]